MTMQRRVSAEEAVSHIRSGDHIYIQGSTSLPTVLIEALSKRGHELKDVTVYYGFGVGREDSPLCKPEFKDSFLIDCFFVNNTIRKYIAEGYGVTTPCFLGEVPSLFREGYWPLEYAFLNCSPPDEQGYVSFGVAADVAVSAAQCAKRVIAQINPNMPFSYGDAVIHMSDLFACVDADVPLLEVPTSPPTDNEKKIGNFIASEIPDGATLQIGVGGIPNATLSALSGHKHLGLHTEAMTDGVLPLIKSGVIDNTQKKIYPGKSIASLALGSKELYREMDYNKEMVFKDVAWTNDPYIISQNPSVMAINSCLEIDITGQICADSIGKKIYSGIGGQHDFVFGASKSEGGKSFLAMLSTTSKGESKIKPVLTEGAGVVTTRFQADRIVTEHGIVSLKGKSLPQRAKLLISIAAPEFREALEREAAARFGYSFLRLK